MGVENNPYKSQMIPPVIQGDAIRIDRDQGTVSVTQGTHTTFVPLREDGTFNTYFLENHPTLAQLEQRGPATPTQRPQATRDSIARVETYQRGLGHLLTTLRSPNLDYPTRTRVLRSIETTSNQAYAEINHLGAQGVDVESYRDFMFGVRTEVTNFHNAHDPHSAPARMREAAAAAIYNHAPNVYYNGSHLIDSALSLFN